MLRAAMSVLVSIGLLGAGQLSYVRLSSGVGCPDLFPGVPACYIAFAGYLLLATALLRWFRRPGAAPHLHFALGAIVVFGLALFASVSELVVGHVCPTVLGVVPACYVSLAMGVVIVGLYVQASILGREH